MLKLILISGRPGVGKSTLAQEIAKTLRVTLLDKDDIDEPFSPNDRGPNYNENIKPKVHEVLLNLAQTNLKLGNSVILDSPWTHNLIVMPGLQDKIARLAKETGAKLCVIECDLNAEQIIPRMKARGLKRDEPKYTAAGFARFVEFHQFGKVNPLPHCRIDMTSSKEQCLEAALKYLNL